MSALATLTGRLTLPYRRGAEFLPIPLGADTNGTTAVRPYDFADYRARWGQGPDAPAYAITLRKDVSGDDLLLTFTWNGGSSPPLTVPRGTRAGTSFCVPMPTGANATLRLTSLTVAPQLSGPGKDAWEIVALLGTITKLVWLLSVEKDLLGRVRDDVRAMRFVNKAFAAGLDALGKDLRVPRFPPRPYSYDDATVALWHLDEVSNGGPVTMVADQTTRPGFAGHPGSVAGASAGAPGKFGTGFAFLANGAAITVAPSPEFDIAANADATIEAFVAPGLPPNATPRAILARRAKETASGSSATPGWSLCVVDARGFNTNVLFALCDGAQEVRIFADVGIADGGFHHIAGIVDRTRKRARLFVDGVQRATAPIDTLGAIAPPDAIRFGSTAGGNALSGTIDEVRISRVARTTFHPALGEDDEAYRARLRIFRRWVLPTPANVKAMINEAAPLPDDPAPYDLVEANQPTQVALRPVRIVPESLAAGTAIALDGTIPQDETVAGTPDDDAGFDPSLDLILYANGSVDAFADPGGGRMQAGTGRVLDALVARLARAAPPGSKLILEHSYDTLGPTRLHSVGRALRLRHQTLAVDALGALAHRAGFAYVRNLGPDLAVAVPAGERLAIRSAPPVGQRADLGSAFDLTIVPEPPLAATFSWTIITPGPARARLVAHSADPATLKTPIASRRRVRLATDLPTDSAGDLAVRVEYGHGGRTRSGTLMLRVDPTTLAIGHALDTLGNPDPDLTAIVGMPDAGFDPAYLVTHAAKPAIDFGADPNNSKMQVVTRDSLDALVALLAARATLTTNGPTAPANATLHFAAVPGTILPGMVIIDLTTAAAIPAGTTVVSTTATTVVMSLNATGAGVGTGDVIQFSTPGRLKVTQAFVPGGPGVESVGRRLVLGHETLDAGALGALASRFFDYVTRAGASVTAFVRPDTWIGIGDAATTEPIPAEIGLGTPINLAVVPGVTLTTNGATAASNATLHFAAVPGTILPGMLIVDLTAGAVIPIGTSVLSTTATTVVMSQNAAGAGVGSGDATQFTNLNGTYNWSTRAIGAGAGSFDTLLRPNARFTPSKSGMLVLALTHVARDASRAAPYTFEIRLKPDLDKPGTFIPKDQYDIIMNILDAFHPIGVEVRTDNVRKHVREIEQDPAKAFPAYSFPNFRF